MSCSAGAAGPGFDFLRRLYPKAVSSRIPLIGVIELTGQCNFRCRHCGAAGARSGGAGQLELTTLQWIGLIDQITHAGCLLLVLSGGECLLRPDFDTIYRHARSRGLLVTVLTNGTIITERTLRMFDAFPPHAIEVSLYGSTAEAYERVTGIAGSFEKCLQGIDRFQRGGFRLSLKLEGVNGSDRNLEYLESAAAGLGISLLLVARDESGRVLTDELSGSLCDLSHLEGPCRCGAGMSLFHISPYGRIRPCQKVPGEGLSLLRAGFINVWRSPDFELFRSAGLLSLRCRTCGKSPARKPLHGRRGPERINAQRPNVKRMQALLHSPSELLRRHEPGEPASTREKPYERPELEPMEVAAEEALTTGCTGQCATCDGTSERKVFVRVS